MPGAHIRRGGDGGGSCRRPYRLGQTRCAGIGEAEVLTTMSIGFMMLGRLFLGMRALRRLEQVRDPFDPVATLVGTIDEWLRCQTVSRASWLIAQALAPHQVAAAS